MRYDADYFTTETFIDKFEKLLDDRYRELKPHKRRNAFIRDYDIKYNIHENGELISIENTVKQWFSKPQAPRKPQRPSIEKLMNICELLDCDIDYFLTKQTDFRKEIANASSITGLSICAAENLAKLHVKNDYESSFILQCINLLLANSENEEVFNLLSQLIYTIDNDECESIETTYNVNSSENEQEFCDRIAKSDFNFLLKYGSSYYFQPHNDNIHLSYLGLELIKQLESLRQKEKDLRKHYKGIVEIHLDYDTAIEEDNSDDIFNWYENKFNKKLSNPNIKISFVE